MVWNGEQGQEMRRDGSEKRLPVTLLTSVRLHSLPGMEPRVGGRCNEMTRHETRTHGVRACANGQADLTVGSLPLTSYFLVSTYTLDIS